MNMELIFSVCFFTGIGLTLLSLLFGQIFDFFGVDGLDFFDVSLDIFIPLSPMVYVLGITVFGGMGLILMQVAGWMPMVVMILIALTVALLVATLFYKGIILPLRKAQNTSSPAQEELIGVLAKVVENIPEKGYGEISYVVNGNTFTAPARSTEGQLIEKGAEVSICWIEQYVFYVARLEEKKN